MSKIGWALLIAVVVHAVPGQQLEKMASATQNALVSGSPDDVGILVETGGETAVVAAGHLEEWGSEFIANGRLERYKNSTNRVVKVQATRLLSWMNDQVRQMAVIKQGQQTATSNQEVSHPHKI